MRRRSEYRRGGHAEQARDDVTTLIERTPASRTTYVKASLLYLGFMTLWVYGFANTERHVPGLVMFVALVLPLLLHAGIGFAIPRQETFALLAYPPLLTLVGPGVDSLLWVPLVMMMVFPGAPLVLLGLYLRRRAEPQEVDDCWF
jgi:hypothetical protein